MADEKEKRTKELNKKKKEELVDLLIKSEDLETRLNEKIENLYKLFEEKLNTKRVFESRLIEVERNISLNNQYERRDTIEIVGIPDNIPQKDLEKSVVDVFSVAGVEVVPRDFQAVHRLKGKNQNTVIAKLTNRKDAQAIIYNRKKLRNLSDEDRVKLHVSEDSKIYINESLCGPFRYLLGKSNAMFKKKMISGFWTANGCLKIKLNNDDKGEGAIAPISHIADLYYLFGKDQIDGLKKV
ncbi:MAG: hypothetical protein HRT69_18595 [Flavobacteriaceae bacterium]|nr:hypothetical protein [Flavobacteriaceae bacterium]